MTKHPEGTKLLARYRQAIEPDSARIDAVWAELADPDAEFRIIERGRARPTPRGRSRLAWAGGIVVLTAAAALAWWFGSTARTAVVVGQPAPQQAGYGAQVPGGVPEASRRGSAGATPSAEVSPEPARAAGRPKAEAPTMPGPAASDPAAGPRARPSPRPREPDPLPRETALVRDAEASLRTGDATGALEILATHAREFPTGALSVERAALRVIALCRDGKRAQGRGEATLLDRHAAARPYQERIRRACAAE